MMLTPRTYPIGHITQLGQRVPSDGGDRRGLKRTKFLCTDPDFSKGFDMLDYLILIDELHFLVGNLCYLIG